MWNRRVTLSTPVAAVSLPVVGAWWFAPPRYFAESPVVPATAAIRLAVFLGGIAVLLSSVSGMRTVSGASAA